MELRQRLQSFSCDGVSQNGTLSAVNERKGLLLPTSKLQSSSDLHQGHQEEGPPEEGRALVEGELW